MDEVSRESNSIDFSQALTPKERTLDCGEVCVSNANIGMNLS
jgi:hypothetical protein